MFHLSLPTYLARTKLAGATGVISFTASGDEAQSTLSIEQLATVNGAPGWQQVTNSLTTR